MEQTDRPKKTAIREDMLEIIKQSSKVMTNDMIDNIDQVNKMLNKNINILSLDNEKNEKLLDDIAMFILDAEELESVALWLCITTEKIKTNKNKLVIYCCNLAIQDVSKTIQNAIKTKILNKYPQFKDVEVKKFLYQKIKDLDTIANTVNEIRNNVIANNQEANTYHKIIESVRQNTEEFNPICKKIISNLKGLEEEETKTKQIIQLIYNDKTTPVTKKTLSMAMINRISQKIDNADDYSTAKAMLMSLIVKVAKASVFVSDAIKNKTLKKELLAEAKERLREINGLLEDMYRNYNVMTNADVYNRGLLCIEKLTNRLNKLKIYIIATDRVIQEEKEAKELEKTQKLDTEKIPNITETVQNDQKIKVEQQLANLQKRYYQEEFKEEEKEEEIINDVDVNIKIAEGKITKLQFKNNELEGFSDDIFAAKIDNPLNANAKIYVVCENKEHQQFFKEITTGANKILPQGSTGHSGFKIANQNSAYFKINRTKNDMSNIDTTKRLSFQIEYLKVNNETVMILTNPSIANKKDTDDMWKESEQPKLNTKTTHNSQKQEK